MTTQSVSPSVHARFVREFGKHQADWILTVGILGLMPFWVQHAINLSWKPHLQFYPLAWLAFACLVVSRSTLSSHPPTAWRRGLGSVFLVSSVLINVVAIIAFSPWLAQMALMNLFAYWLLVRTSSIKNHWYELLVWLSLFAITIPLPMNLDVTLIQYLQRMSSESASVILDYLSIPHLLQGNIVEVNHGRLFVDQACSGIDSLYALAAATLILLVWRRKSLVPTAIVLVSVAPWAWFGNVVRLTTIGLLLSKYQIDLTHGWKHSLLGLGTFAIAFLGMYFTQEIATILLLPIRVASQAKTWAHSLYNRVVAWPSPPSSPSNGTTEPTVPDRHVRFWWLPSSVFLICGLISFAPVLGVGPWRQLEMPNFDRGRLESTFNRESMNEQSLVSNVVDFEFTTREEGHIQGEYSAVWHLVNESQRFIVSLDFPFDKFHHLEVCYELIGNKIVSPARPIMYQSKWGEQYIQEVELIDQFSEKSYLIYMEFSADGTSDRAQNPWKQFVPAQSTKTLYQIQLLLKNYESVSQERRLALHRILLESQSCLMPIIQGIEAEEK